MADEKAPETKPEAPIFDPAMVKAAMKESLAEMVASMPQPQPQRQVQPQYQAPADPVRDAVYPSLRPDLDRLSLQSAAATDAAVFYATNPKAAKHSSLIEQKFNEAISVGRPIARADIFKWVKGDKFEEFAKEQQAEQADAERLANLASTAGAGFGRVAMDPTGKDPREMSDEELENALKGHEF